MNGHYHRFDTSLDWHVVTEVLMANGAVLIKDTSAQVVCDTQHTITPFPHM